jgi:hypothetical protein
LECDLINIFLNFLNFLDWGSLSTVIRVSGEIFEMNGSLYWFQFGVCVKWNYERFRLELFWDIFLIFFWDNLDWS